MEFEPVILAGFEPRVQTGLNPFEPVASNGKSVITVNMLTSGITSELTVLCNNTARTTLWIVARAEMLVLKTASAQVIWSRRKGGSK
jgi:hypothetical protein